MEPRRDAERFRPLFIDIWIGNIIVSGVEGVIFTLIFLVVTIFWKTAHTSSTILVTTQLVLVFLIGSLKALNIFIHSTKNQNTESASRQAVSVGCVIITLVITPPIAIHARMGPFLWLLILVFITGILASELLFPAPAASKKKRRNDDYENNYHLLFLTV